MFQHKFGSFPSALNHFLNLFPQITKKIAKIEIVQKIAKEWVKFQNFAISDLHQHIIHQKKGFFM